MRLLDSERAVPRFHLAGHLDRIVYRDNSEVEPGDAERMRVLLSEGFRLHRAGLLVTILERFGCAASSIRVLARADPLRVQVMHRADVGFAEHRPRHGRRARVRHGRVRAPRRWPRTRDM